jgi:hypothetical protein
MKDYVKPFSKYLNESEQEERPKPRKKSYLPDKENDSPQLYKKKMEILKKTIQKALEQALDLDDEL